MQFKNNCYSILDIQVQSVLIDYKFRQGKNASNVCEFLFQQKNLTPDLNMIDSIFDDYSKVMNYMFQTMRRRYNTFIDKFFTEK